MSKLVDSDVIVFAFTNNPKKDVCRRLIENERITVNTLILLESFGKVATITKERELAVNMVRLFYKAGNVDIVNFDTNLFFEALKKSGQYHLRISDLVHYTTPVLNNCSAVVSYDKDFDNLGLKRVEP